MIKEQIVYKANIPDNTGLASAYIVNPINALVKGGFLIKESKIVLSKEELVEIIGNAFMQGSFNPSILANRDNTRNRDKAKQEYINKLIEP